MGFSKSLVLATSLVSLLGCKTSDSVSENKEIYDYNLLSENGVTVGAIQSSNFRLTLVSCPTKIKYDEFVRENQGATSRQIAFSIQDKGCEALLNRNDALCFLDTVSAQALKKLTNDIAVQRFGRSTDATNASRDIARMFSTADSDGFWHASYVTIYRDFVQEAFSKPEAQSLSCQ
jgi:hypothetical protein